MPCIIKFAIAIRDLSRILFKNEFPGNKGIISHSASFNRHSQANNDYLVLNIAFPIKIEYL